MNNEFLEFKMRVYAEKDLNNYAKELKEAEEKAEDYNMELDDSDIPPPIYVIGRIKIRPSNIKYYIETFSIEEKIVNPVSPSLDNTSVTMDGGEEFTFDLSYDEFEKKLEEFYARDTK